MWRIPKKHSLLNRLQDSCIGIVQLILLSFNILTAAKDTNLFEFKFLIRSLKIKSCSVDLSPAKLCLWLMINSLNSIFSELYVET